MNLRLTDSTTCEATRDIAATIIVGLTNAKGYAKSCVIAWQSDDKTTCWNGESGAACACGCGPSEPPRYD
jgi:hypothetical protein